MQSATATPSFAAGRMTVIRVFDEVGEVIETHEHRGESRDPSALRALCGQHHVLPNDCNAELGEKIFVTFYGDLLNTYLGDLPQLSPAEPGI
jgi:hypothetical protein